MLFTLLFPDDDRVQLPRGRELEKLEELTEREKDSVVVRGARVQTAAERVRLRLYGREAR